MDHSTKPRVGDLAARSVESRCMKHHVEALPLPRRQGRIDPWRNPLISPVVSPALVDAPAIRVFRARHAVTVEDLYLVAPLKVHAGVGALGHHKLDMGDAVAKLGLAEQVHRLPIRTIDEDTVFAVQVGQFTFRRRDFEEKMMAGDPQIILR